MKLSSSKIKPKNELIEPYIMKKQRTKCRRRLRSLISPILISRLSSAPARKSSEFSVDSSSCLYFADEVSCDSSRVTVEPSSSKRKLRESEGIRRTEDGSFRRITRSFSKQKESERRGNEEVSESSCVESNSGVDCVVSEKRRSLKVKKRAENSKEVRIDEDSVTVTKPEISPVQLNLDILPYQSEENDAVSIASGVESCLSNRTIEGGSKNRVLELSEISKNDAVSVDESVVEQKPKSLGLETDLSCAEHFSYNDDAVSDHYSPAQETAFSELQSEIFMESSSDLEFSDYTPSIFLDSGTEFSEKSATDSPPSRTYSLLLEFRQQFSRLSIPLDNRRPLLKETEDLDNSSFMRFKNEDDEETYQRLRERERQLFLHDYIELYCSTTQYGDLILHQRCRMVHWIVEQSTAKEFQLETMFLGVSLLDRFLCNGFFNNKRTLQIVGIACLTLATRIEENQPYNSVRQKNFHIGSNTYSRFEVVAMEWLVQEVLNFQCFLPTIHNFMWFYLKTARADAELEKRARYLARLALSDHEHLRHRPSTVAAALIILASLERDLVKSYQRVIEVHVRTVENDLHACIKTLEWLLQYAS